MRLDPSEHGRTFDAKPSMALSARGAPRWRIENSRFGPFVAIDMPPGTDTVCLYRDQESGHKPVAVYLPHQVYVDVLLKHLADCPSLTLVPYCNANKIEITRADIAGLAE